MASAKYSEHTSKNSEKGTAYFWKSTSIEPHISSLNLRHGISRVSLGNEHTLLLTFNAEVLAVGENTYGQLGFGDLTRRREPTNLSFFSGKNVVDIACGSHHSAALCHNGELFCWGDSSNGQCGIGDVKVTDFPTAVRFSPDVLLTPSPATLLSEQNEQNPESPQPKQDQGELKIKIKKVACGDSHTLALSSDGRLWSWGSGCQIGHGPHSDKVNRPQEVEALKGKDVLAIACGAYHSMVLIKDVSMQIKLLPQKIGNSRFVSNDQSQAKKLRKFSKTKETLKRKKSLGGKSQSPALLHSSDINLRGSNSPASHSNEPKTYLSYEAVSSNKRKDSQNSNMTGKTIDQASIISADSSMEHACTYSTVKGEVNEDPCSNGSAALVTQDQQINNSCSEVAKNRTHKPVQLNTKPTCSTSSPTMLQSSVTSTCSSPIDIHNNYFGFPGQRYVNLDDSSPESLSPQGGFLKLTSPTCNVGNSLTEGEDVFIAREVSGSLDSLCLHQSVMSGSVTGTYSMYSSGTDSESEDFTHKAESKSIDKIQSEPRKAYLGFGILVSQLRPGMDFGKLRNAVDSVTGMFMSASPNSPVTQVAKSIMPNPHCVKCGISGLCLCSETPVNQGKFGLPGSSTQVWTWGRGGCGQLGHGDTDDRSVPCCVEGLSGTGVIKISAGTFHSLGLTVYCQVFSWGDNSCGQLGLKKTIAVKPRKVKCFSDVLIWDISCGSHYSLFAGDMALNRPDVYICGRQPSEMPAIAASLKKREENSPISHDDITIQCKDKKRQVLRHSRSFDDVKERSLGAMKVELVRLTMFRKVGSVRCVIAHTEHCCCLAARDPSGQTEVLSELASEERLFYYQLALIWQVVLVPVIHSDVWSTMVHQDSGRVLAHVVKAFYQLMKCVSTSVMTTTIAVQDMTSIEELYSTCLSKEFVVAFERYSEVFSNAVAHGVFTLFANVSSDIAVQCKAILQELLEEPEEDFIECVEAFQCVAQVPLARMQHYVTLTKKLLALLPKGNAESAKLMDMANMWGTLLWQDEKRQLVAEQTRQFWENCPSRLAETFKVPNRRLLKSSKSHPLYPVKSARFSCPSYLLFDDYFIHVQSNKNFQAYPLSTLWAESVDDVDSLVHAIKLTTPEEVLLVCAPCDNDKAEWLLTINQAVARVISKTTTYRLGSDAVNTSTGSLSAAAAREATYTFMQDVRYKAATYQGMWLAGKPHGHGQMQWTDRRHYTGEFKQGVHHGHGVMVFPPGSADTAERYEGQWINGKLAGFGKMRYTNGDTYTGNWRENARNGHGIMNYGALSSSAASVYIGDWMGDKKHGYGTMDDVLKGEKYMGMWDNDCCQGAGVIVTLDGLYSQGNFTQSKLTGTGLLLCDDNTLYEGEFAGHCQLSGKGILTMANGDYMDGTFFGQWGDGIKVNGTFYKTETDNGVKHSSTEPEVTSFVSADQKWMALFHQCREDLGCYDDREAEPQIVWKCISMALLDSHDEKPLRAQQDMQELLNINNEMERTGKYSLDPEALQSYLAKAFDVTYHPLGTLVAGLVYAYRATYLGMGTHRRLLSHAVAEAKSFIHRIYRITRLLFPDLPNEDYVHLATDTVTGIAQHHTEESTASSALLHPVLLPRLYPPLFTLYALNNERADNKYWERVVHLYKRSDRALMTYVGVKRQFWLTSSDEIGTSTDKDETCDTLHYGKAVEALQQISTKLSPMEKLGVLKVTFEKINEEVEIFWQGEEKLISLDDLFPVFHFVVIRARIPHLGSEIHFIDDMVDNHVHVGEQGHMFTTLKACFFQIQNEKG